MQLRYILTAYPPLIGGAQRHQHLLVRQLLRPAISRGYLLLGEHRSARAD